MAAVDHCRICAQPLFDQPLLVQDDMPAAAQGLPSAEQLPGDRGVRLALRQCGGCGLVQLDAEPVPYWRDVIRAAGISPEMRDFRLEQFGGWLAEHGLTGRKVLEVGCGRGEYLSLLAEAGADAYGVEHLPASVDACRQAGLRVEQGFVDCSPSSSRTTCSTSPSARWRGCWRPTASRCWTAAPPGTTTCCRPRSESAARKTCRRWPPARARCARRSRAFWTASNPAEWRSGARATRRWR
ncbi:methionine biosynthesis protein MetW (plasmid) [Chromobacterium amazonense]|uniref:methionine biosynthesis protein MetW n=1 Tax=Chromobacterium amazonense TaxID=1382803 RepID=UPI00237ED38E|nr:methionine biosynthesis protein MetW [Chromobacterium amazonense]MDE1714470.1 methionine biosynthesis protein MetW [Chromobacterium amazonense]